MAPKRKLSDVGGGDGPDPAADPTPADEADDAGGPMVSIWSCDNPSVEVEFPVQHAWLLLRNWFEPSMGEELTKEQRMQELVDSGVVSLRMQPRSCCTKEVLECIRDYVRDYVLPDGAYKAAGVWNFRGDATLAIGERRAIGGTLELGALCWKLLQAADFLDIEIWPEEAVKRRNYSNQTHPTGHGETRMHVIGHGETCMHVHAQPIFASACTHMRNQYLHPHALLVHKFALTQTISNAFNFCLRCHRQIARSTTKFARSWPALLQMQQASRRSEISAE